MFTVLIAADHKPLREALTRLLLSQPSFCVVAVCADTHAAIAIAAAEHPNVVLIDGSSDPLATIEATKKIVSCSSANVIAFSHDVDPAFAQHMLAAGALGYITRRSAAADIITAVEEVAKDNVYLCNELSPAHKQAPLSTTDRSMPAPAKKSRVSIGHTIREKIASTTAIHWHGILRFTN